jgi:hypothetical protein
LVQRGTFHYRLFYGRRDLTKTKDSLPTDLTVLLVRSVGERWWRGTNTHATSKNRGGPIPTTQTRMAISNPETVESPHDHVQVGIRESGDEYILKVNSGKRFPEAFDVFEKELVDLRERGWGQLVFRYNPHRMNYARHVAKDRK